VTVGRIPGPDTPERNPQAPDTPGPDAAGFLYDTHVHTAEVSGCARIPARQVVRLYRDAGYTGIVVTDHLTRGTLERLGGAAMPGGASPNRGAAMPGGASPSGRAPSSESAPWQGAIERYLSGYEIAREEGARVGLVVLPGLEMTFDDPEPYGDYLVFGLAPEMLRAHPDLFRLGLRGLRRFLGELAASGRGAPAPGDILIYQAHPFRTGNHPADPALLDGVEIRNGNPRHDSDNRRAEAFAARHGLRRLSGSDFHQLDDLAQGGMRLPERVTDMAGFVRLLRENRAVPLLAAAAAATPAVPADRDRKPVASDP